MIGHWLKSAWRSLVANPLFSLITIASLSVGCCGAFLAGSNIYQHLSFDRWIPQADRIAYVTLLQLDPFAAMGNQQTTMRFEGPGFGKPVAGVMTPMRAAIEGAIPGLEAQARLIRGGALLQEDQDAVDRRQAAGPPPPGETPPPYSGTVYVDPDFFDMFELEFIEGSAELLSEPDRIVLTQVRAQQIFGKTSATGQSVEGVKGRSLTVVGVVANPPYNSHIQFESAAGVVTLEAMAVAAAAAQAEANKRDTNTSGSGTFFVIGSNQTDGWSGFRPGVHYLKFADGVSFDAFKEEAVREIQAAGDRGAQSTTPPPGYPPGLPFTSPKYTYSVERLLSMHLGEAGGASSANNWAMLITLAISVSALLIVSAFNYVTLSLARSLRRRREVAVRKALGGDRASLVLQYLVESSLVTLIAIALGFALAWFLHPWFARLIGQPDYLFELADPGFLTACLVGFVVLALAVGGYPAFYLASVRPRTALGDAASASPGHVGRLISASLLGLQIASAAGLTIVSAIMLAQANYIATRPLGFSMTGKYQFTANCPVNQELSQQELSARFRRCQTGIKDIVARTRDIGDAFYFSGSILTEFQQTQAFGRSAGGEETGRAARVSVEPGFLQDMDAILLAGRLFDPTSAYDRQIIDRSSFGARDPTAPRPAPIEVLPVVVTRAALPIVGATTPEEALGLRLAPLPSAPYPYEIVGVVEDWHQRPLNYELTPVIFLPVAGSNAILRIEARDVESVRTRLRDDFRDYIGDPLASVSVQSLGDLQQRAYQNEYRLMRAVSAFALVAIMVAGLGVFGLSSFDLRRRVREIGIRKALGASPFTVAAREVARRVAFAAGVSLLAWPIALWVGADWLTSFVYRTPLTWMSAPVGTVTVMAIVTLAVALSATGPALRRPNRALNP